MIEARHSWTALTVLTATTVFTTMFGPVPTPFGPVVSPAAAHAPSDAAHGNVQGHGHGVPAIKRMAPILIQTPPPTTGDPANDPSTAQPTIAQDRCLALAQGPNQLLPVHRATFEPIAPVPITRIQAASDLKPYQIRLTFRGHATFLIETARGVKAATDYAVPIPEPDIPDLVTMNIAHEPHFTYSPQPEIKHILPGWNDKGGPVIHDITVQDMRVRNVPTNIRSWGGETMEFGNSIFVFEIGALCVAHLGHLHHPLTTQQLANIGQMDVVLAPVDGSFTLDTPGMLEVVKAMSPRILIPMHYFTARTLQRFLDAAGKAYPVKMFDNPTIVISKDELPLKTEIYVLPGI